MNGYVLIGIGICLLTSIIFIIRENNDFEKRTREEYDDRDKTSSYFTGKFW